MDKRKGRRWAATKGEKMAQGLAEAVEVGECLEWQGFFQCAGVTPIVKARNPEKGRTDNYSVVRALWEAAYGPVPDGMRNYRTCCNNSCVLLDHITIGTHRDWAQNRAKAGLTRHHQSTIIAITLASRRRANVVNSLDKAREVRTLKADGLHVDDIAEQTGVSRAMVADISNGNAWAEIGNPFSGLGARRTGAHS